MVISEPVNVDLFPDVASLHPLFSTFWVERSDDQKTSVFEGYESLAKKMFSKIIENRRSWQRQ